MNKRILYGLVVAVLGLNLFFGAQVYLASASAGDKGNSYEQMRILVTVLEKVRQEYVDGDKLTYEDLVRGALKGMLSSLDPHSEYMEPRKHEDLKHDTEGKFGGVGIVVGLKDDYLTVVSPIEDTPAHGAGILTGDRIIKIDGVSTERIDLPKAVERLRGEPGSSVVITVTRPSWTEPRDISLTRAEIKVATVKDIEGRRQFTLNEDKIGYVRLTQFGEQTASDLRDAVRKMLDQGMKGLVLDLRWNPGGLLPQAVKVCEMFLKRGELVVYTEGQSAEAKDKWYAQGRDLLEGKPIVVLVNNGSASASEIVSGCLQDLGRAFVIGEQTFGKGSVQTIIPLPDGAALRLTTAKYYTPSSKVIHERGITPDSLVPMSTEEEEALMLKRSLTALDNLPEEQQAVVKEARDLQLERAYDFLKGVTILKGRNGERQKLSMSRR